VPQDGVCVVRIWQANIGKTIIDHVPVRAGQVQETGAFELDGVTFPAAEIVLEFMEPADEGGRRRDVHGQRRRRIACPALVRSKPR
jgi:2-methylaconitate cis-trans-isomerase PrpF